MNDGDNMNTNPETLHFKALKQIKPSLHFNPDNDFYVWREKVKKQFDLILKKPPKILNSPPEIKFEKRHDGYNEIRFIFESEKGYFVPCHYLYPANVTGKIPVIICLQGHSPGMHISLGVAHNEKEQISIDGDRDFALQAVKQGYGALVMEQRCFGECGANEENKNRGGCNQTAMQALLLGRTLIGERALDISRAVDCIEFLPYVDVEKIGCMGNSGGGTAAYYASCTEERIKAIMPSCAVCTIEDSIFSLSHCQCNYMPDMLKYFEMADLSCLLAPRKLIVISGIKDKIFPNIGVQKAFDSIKAVYAAANAQDNCVLVSGQEGHRFYADIGWSAFKELTGW